MRERVETRAIVIQRFAYGESSQVVHLLTEELGRVAVLARGAYRAKNGYEGPLDLLARGRVTIALVQGRELGLLLARRVETHYPELRRSLPRFAAAMHVLRQVVHFEPVGSGGSDAFRLVDRGLTALSTLPPERIGLFLLAFDSSLLRQHGLAPELSSCVRCASPLRLARFLAAEGGAVCRDCLRLENEGVAFDAATAALLRDVAVRRLDRVAAPPAVVLARARRILDEHLVHHAETPPHSSRWSRASGSRRPRPRLRISPSGRHD